MKNNFLKGVVIGAIAGGISIALTTPKTGRQMRQEIKEESQSLYTEGKKIAFNTADNIEDLYYDNKQKINEVKEDTLSQAYKAVDQVNSKINNIGNKEI